MVNKALSDWIKLGEERGYTEEQLREYLLNLKYPNEEVEEAIELFKKKPEPKKKTFKDMFKPSFFNLFIPIFLLIILIASFYVNSTYLPEMTKTMCESLSKMQEQSEAYNMFDKKVYEYNIDPQLLIDFYNAGHQSMDNSDINGLSRKTILISLANLNLDFGIDLGSFSFTPILTTIDPFFPTPCENSIFLNSNYKNACAYYSSEDTYNCFIEQQQASDSDPETIVASSLFIQPSDPPYKHISLMVVFLHIIGLSILSYLLVCIISFVNLKFTELNLWLKIGINIFVILLLVLFFNQAELSSAFSFLLMIILFFIIFASLSFFKEEKKRKIFLYVLSILIILFLIGTLFYLYYNANQQMETYSNTEGMESTAFQVFSCNVTRNLTTEEKQLLQLNQTELNETYELCDQLECSDQCTNYAQTLGQFPSTKNLYLRGDRPSCLCIATITE